MISPILLQDEVDFFDKMDGVAPMNPSEVIGDIMLESCPENMILQLLVTRAQLRAMDLSDDNATKFLAATTRHRGGYPSAHQTWAAYQAWLLEQDGDSELVLFALCECRKGDDLGRTILSNLEELGLSSH